MVSCRGHVAGDGGLEVASTQMVSSTRLPPGGTGLTPHRLQLGLVGTGVDYGEHRLEVAGEVVADKRDQDRVAIVITVSSGQRR
jgi:hypothetical protein